MKYHTNVFFVPVWIILGIFLAVSASSWYPHTIPNDFREVATQQGVPPSLLYSISVVESGAQPWVLCVKGVGHFYNSREAAYDALQYYRHKGITNIDVGIMQVNWKYHHKRFADDWEMLDPQANMTVGAQILRECYEKTGDWLRAVGYYHSPSVKWRANNYRNRVYNIERSLDATTQG
jgi:soluble lytic murein transglycosylase-like protein